MANTTKCSKWFTNNTLTKKPLVEHPKNSFQAIFRRLDADADGRISRDELRAFLGWAGDRVLPEEAAAVVRDLDVDGDGFIDYRTFVELVGRGVGVGGELGGYDEDIRNAFGVFEGEEGEGCITPEGL